MSDDAIYKDPNDLDNKTSIETSSKPIANFEDLPLFPPLKDKPKIVPTINNQLIKNNDEILLESGVEDELLLDNGISGNLISDTQNTILPAKDLNIKIEDTTPILIDSEVPLISAVLPTGDPKISEGHVDSEPVSSNIPVNVPGNSQNQLIKNSKIVSSPKIVQVPHSKIKEFVVSDHPLALPPRVIPFSTYAPSAHSKIAAVYTQPEGMAAAWLPWMRTSAWSKKMVKKATKNPNIEDIHAGLPMNISEKKPNVVYSPVYIDTTFSNIPKKVEETIFESGASVIHMNYEIPEKNIEDKTLPIIKFDIPEIKDKIDTEMFGKFIKPISTESNNAIIAQTEGEKPKIAPVVNQKPNIQDSWDAAIFS